MSAQRRSGRQRAANTRLNDLPDSSPTQPRSQAASRKRKATGGHAPVARNRRQRSPEEQDAETEEEDEEEDDDDDDDSEDSENKALADMVIPYLDVSVDPVAVAEAHSNSLADQRYGKGNVNAFAKLCGKEWTYYIVESRINFGRQPDEGRQSMVGGTGEETKDASTDVHIDLGPSKMVSRRHAELYFASADEKWHVQVHGRNGVRINDLAMRRGEDRAIQNGDVIAIAGTQMLFQSVEGKTTIHQMFIDRILAHQNNEGVDAELGSGNAHALPERPMQPLRSGPSPYDHAQYGPAPGPGSYMNGQIPFAPPPGYPARPVTPDTSPQMAATSAKKRSPGYRRGIMMESTEQIDYSLDSSKDLKPGCSYAAMITWAILSTPDEALSLNGIYDWIKKHYAYYRLTPSGWQNSIRHNLSLNASFGKIARRSDEPGKGMKWHLIPEHRQSTIAQANKNASKGGGRTSSAPGSPAGAAVTGGFAPPTLDGNLKNSPGLPSQRTPPLSSYPPAQQESFTPSRGPQIPAYAPTQGTIPVLSDEQSPLPRHRTNGQLSTVASSPVLNSYSWTPDQSANTLSTPAPRAHNLNIPQPNTIKLPTSHMAYSSPAPFWHYTEPLGSTPLRPTDISPQKIGNASEGGILQSSSPPPPATGVESPSRRTRPVTASFGGGQNGNVGGLGEDEDGGIDLMKGFTKISSYHQQRNNMSSASAAS